MKGSEFTVSAKESFS